MLVNDQFESASQSGGPPKIGGAGPSSGGVFTTGSQPRFLSHQEARQQILGVQPQQAQQTQQQGSQTPSYGSLADIGKDLSRRGSSLGQNIQQAGQSFNEKVGAAPTYNQDELLGAINPRATDDQRASAMAGARNQIDDKYAGPNQIDPEEIAKIAGDIGDYGLTVKSLGTGGGVQSEIQRRIPGMNQGMARSAAERMMREDPGYRRNLVDESQRAAALGVELEQEQARAMELANLRREQEKQVASQATDFLKQQKSDVFARLQKEAEAKNAQNAAAAAAYDAAVADPTKSNLEALDPYTDANLQGFEDPRALTAEAKAAYADVMRRYAEAHPEIAAYPALQKTITQRGETWYGIPNADGTVTDIRKIKGMSKKTEKALVARQRELEALFYPRREKNKLRKEEGEYANIMPLYYGEGGSDPNQNIYGGRDPADYLSLDPGNTVTMDVLASSDDRTLVDNVNSLLGESDRLMEGGDPFRAAVIAADVDKYLSDVEADLNARAGQLDEADAKFHLAVRKARHRYKKAKAKGVAKDFVNDLMGRYSGTLKDNVFGGVLNTANGVFDSTPSSLIY